MRNLIISILINTLLFSFFIILNLKSLDYYIIPLYITSIIIVYYIIPGFIYKDFFSPTFIISLTIYHLFIIAPLLHINFNFYYMFFFKKYDVWKSYYNNWASLNLIGVILFYCSLHLFNKIKPLIKNKKKNIYDIRTAPFYFITTLFLLFSLVIQLYVYHKFGGILGYIKAKETIGPDAFKGLGKFAIIAESFPIIFMFLAVFYYRNKKLPWVNIFILMFIFILLKILFGGLSGSRSNTIWGLFWCLALIHFFIRKLNIKFITLCTVFIISFMLVYGVYKKYKTDFFYAIENHGISSNNYYNTATDSILLKSILTDFSRADIQSFAIYSQSEGYYNKLRYGETYISSLLLFIPNSLLDLERKGSPGAELLHQQYDKSTSRVLGLQGEFIINFPYYFYPLVFIPIAFFISRLQLIYKNRTEKQLDLLILPFFINIGIILFLSDSDNIAYFILKNGFIPMCIYILLNLITYKKKLYD